MLSLEVPYQTAGTADLSDAARSSPLLHLYSCSHLRGAGSNFFSGCALRASGKGTLACGSLLLQVDVKLRDGELCVPRGRKVGGNSRDLGLTKAVRYVHTHTDVITTLAYLLCFSLIQLSKLRAYQLHVGLIPIFACQQHIWAIGMR